MSVPYMPLYVDDFEAAAAHLTLVEDGIYSRLLRLCWRTSGCSIPDDVAWVSRRMRVDLETYHRQVEPIIREFFSRENGRIFQGRQKREYERILKASSEKSKGGRKGMASRYALKTNDNEAKTVITQLLDSYNNQNHNQNQNQKGKKEPVGSSKKGSRLSPDWALPKGWRDWAAGERIPAHRINQEAARFRDYWISVPGQRGVKLDWEATWRNWMRKVAADMPPAPVSASTGPRSTPAIYDVRVPTAQEREERRQAAIRAQQAVGVRLSMNAMPKQGRE